MPNVNPNYTAALALQCWNYIRYVGPLPDAQTEPLFLCMRQGELVVAANRQGSTMPGHLGQWYVNRLGSDDDDLNRHACSFKREGAQEYIGYRFPLPQRNGEVVIGPWQARFDVFRVSPMRKPCRIKVYQDPCPPVEESCEEGAGNSAEPIVDDAAMEMDTEVNDADKPEKEEEPAKPALDWYLGVSQDLKVVLQSFPVPSEGSSEVMDDSDKPIWELTTREEAMNEDRPTVPAPVVPDPRAANNPMRTEFYTRPGRLEAYERSFWPRGYNPYR